MLLQLLLWFISLPHVLVCFWEMILLFVDLSPIILRKGGRLWPSQVATWWRNGSRNKSNRNIRVISSPHLTPAFYRCVIISRFNKNLWCFIYRYLAPEYAQSGQITEKADVYSFGVVLVELFTGRKAVDLNRPKGQQCLTEWVRIPVFMEAVTFYRQLIKAII